MSRRKAQRARAGPDARRGPAGQGPPPDAAGEVGSTRAPAANNIASIAARDGWRCWLCEGEVDPHAPPGSPAAPSVDHVVPRSRGGTNDPANLRLAHRRCNGRRGSALPELAWPKDLGVLDAVPLWQVLARLARRPGDSELVAVLPTAARAEEAAAWVADRATRFLGGEWEARSAPLAGGAAELHGLHLGARSGSAVREAGRPKLADPRRSRAGRRRARRP